MKSAFTKAGLMIGAAGMFKTCRALFVLPAVTSGASDEGDADVTRYIGRGCRVS